MNRKRLVSVCMAIIVVANTGAVFFITRSQPADSITFEQAQEMARRATQPTACYELKSQTIPTKDRRDITDVLNQKVTDVPATTASAVFFKSYDAHRAVGTLVYDGVGNTFNFTVDGVKSGWKLVAFEPCETRL